jgi:hypothetical protein
LQSSLLKFEFHSYFLFFLKLDYLRAKDKQLEELEAKTAQILAVMPVDTHFQLNSLAMTASTSNMDQSDTYAKNPQLNAG